MQLEAAIPNFTIHEHHVYNRYDYNKKLCKYDYQPVDGYIAVPDLPGIGNELTDYCFTNWKGDNDRISLLIKQYIFQRNLFDRKFILINNIHIGECGYV